MSEKNKFGQYMTPQIVADFMVNLIEHDKGDSCLEPSAGEGIFISELGKNGFKNILGIEADKELIKIPEIVNKSFVSADLPQKFDVIIGNPPYIRWKNLEEKLKKELENSELWNTYCNSFCDYSSIFILKAIEALNEGGELIFITSDYWFSTTHAKELRNYILENGYIKEIYHFNETPIFDNVNVSFVIFKYIKTKNQKPEINVTKYFSKKRISKNDLEEIKSKQAKKAEYFTIPQFEPDKKWILLPSEKLIKIEKYEKSCNGYKIGDFCDIGNGMVSGLDKAFQIPENKDLNPSEKENSIEVLKAKDLKTITYGKSTNYIFFKKDIDEKTLKTKFPSFFVILSEYKTKLLKRYNYGKELKFWEWAFLRNFNLFKNGRDRIFCPCKERISNKNRFRFSLVQPKYYPTQDVTALLKKENTKEDLRYITALLNSRFVFDWLSAKGTRKGDIIEFSEKPIASIPYRKIDFSDKKEKELHNKIISLTEEYKKSEKETILTEIDKCIEELI